MKLIHFYKVIEIIREHQDALAVSVGDINRKKEYDILIDAIYEEYRKEMEEHFG